MNQQPGNREKMCRRQAKLRKRKKRSGRILLLFLCLTIISLGLIGLKVYAHRAPEEPSGPAMNELPAPDSGEDSDVFADAVFVGNSYIENLRTYNLPPAAHFLSRVGLTVDTVWKQPVSGSEDTALTGIGAGEYGKVFLLFGENELGWDYPQVFVDEYARLIEEIQRLKPQAAIYILGLLPVSAAIDSANEDHTNNSRIREYNERLRILAWEKSIDYVPPPAELFDEDLALTEAAATDGIHLNYEYDRLWLADLQEYLAREKL